MSFVCCEESPVALTTCATTSWVPIGPVPLFASESVSLDVSRAPYRRACLHADAPITVTANATTAALVTVTLSLFRVGVLTPLETSQVFFTLGSAEVGTATPSLQLTVEPGRYYVTVEVSRASGLVTVVGRINASASVVTLPA
jgi:hypothetical protein